MVERLHFGLPLLFSDETLFPNLLFIIVHSLHTISCVCIRAYVCVCVLVCVCVCAFVFIICNLLFRLWLLCRTVTTVGLVCGMCLFPVGITLYSCSTWFVLSCNNYSGNDAVTLRSLVVSSPYSVPRERLDNVVMAVVLGQVRA